jgi:hypothetical protein
MTGPFEGRLLASASPAYGWGYTMLDARTGEVLETWAGPYDARYLAGWYGGARNPAAYLIEDRGDGPATSWRLSWLDPRTLRPAGTPLFETNGGSPLALTAEGNYLFVQFDRNLFDNSDESVMVLTAWP